MFINLSNHPSGGWGHEQMEEAQKYGTVVDVAFPQIATDANSSGIDDLVKEKYTEFCNIIKDHQDEYNVIMVEGEFVFTYRMVKMLKEHGIMTVAAITARETREEKQSDGSVKKISKFRFEGFREY